MMVVSEDFFVDFPLRGTRTYIHSTSICNHLAQTFGPWDHFEITFKSWMNSRVVFHRVDQIYPKQGAGFAKVIRGNETILLSFKDDKNHPIQTTEAYDEDGITTGFDCCDQKIYGSSSSLGSFFDRLIAFNKKLINQSLDPKVKLIAAKISLDRPVNDECDFLLTLTSHVGHKIFKSQIDINQRRAGEVIFYGQ